MILFLPFVFEDDGVDNNDTRTTNATGSKTEMQCGKYLFNSDEILTRSLYGCCVVSLSICLITLSNFCYLIGLSGVVPRLV